MNTTRTSRGRWSAKWSVPVGVMMVAVGMLSFNAYADFTAAQTATQSVTTGTMTITLANSTFTTAATLVVPGDTIERKVDFNTGGNLTMQNIKLATTAGCGGCTSSLMDTDATNGLQLVVQTCSVAWTGSNPATCSGTQQTVLTTRALIFSATTLSNIDLNGTVDHLKFILTLPSTADDTFQGLTTVVQYTFTGTQPTAGYK